MGPGELGLGGGAGVDTEALGSQGALLGGKEHGFFGRVSQAEPGEEADDQGGGALDDKDPLPAQEAALAVELGDAVGEDAAKGAAEGGHGEPEAIAGSELGAGVESRDHEDDAGDETRLGEAEEEAGGEEAAVVLDSGHGHHDGAPDDHDDGDPQLGADFLEL